MKLGIIGHVGANKEFADGQTIKTRELIDALKQYTDWKICLVDTYYKKKNPLKLLWDTACCIFFCDDIIILLSRNGLKFYMPLLYIVSKFFGKRIYHDIIGGNDKELLKKNPSWAKYMNSFVVNWSETYDGVQQLKKFGIKNAEILPNFKKLKPLYNVVDFNDLEGEIVFCTFSRVCEEKGISDAITACANVAKCVNKNIKLHIYGQIDEGYKSEFETMLCNNPIVSYKGVVPYNDSVNVLKNYYMLLFPTKWESEGMPGTIIDAFAAGCPIIAREWINSNMIEQWKSGIVYPNNITKTLEETILWSINNSAEVNKMRLKCINEFEKYTPQRVCEIIISRILKHLR